MNKTSQPCKHIEKILRPWNNKDKKGYIYISVNDNVKAEGKLKNLPQDKRSGIEAIYQLYGIYDFCIELLGTQQELNEIKDDLEKVELGNLIEPKPLIRMKPIELEIYPYSSDGLIKYCGIEVDTKQQKGIFYDFEKHKFIPFIIQVNPSHPSQDFNAKNAKDISEKIKKKLSDNNIGKFLYTVGFNEKSVIFILIVGCDEYYTLNKITKLMDEVVEANDLQKITYPIAGIIHYDVNETRIKWAWKDQARGLENNTKLEAIALLNTLEGKARLEEYQIVGNYVLYNRKLSGELLTLKKQIESLVSEDNNIAWNKSYIYTLHGTSRSGKSFFVEELGRNLHKQKGIIYKYIDLAKKDKSNLESFIKECKESLEKSNKVFAFIDEIDTPGKEFAFPMLFNIIRDWGKKDNYLIIWFFTGSNGNNLTECLEKIKAKDAEYPKANDFVNRIKSGKMIEIPSPSTSDKIIVACNVAKAQNFQFAEKSVLLYFAMQKDTLEAIHDALIEIRNKATHETTLKSDLIGYEDYSPFVENNEKLLQDLGKGIIKLA